MNTDNANELNGAKGWSNVTEIKQSYIEPGSPWQNADEREIGAIKKAILKAMPRTNASRHLWDFAAEHVSQLISHTP